MADLRSAGGFEDKLVYFQAITGIEDADLCIEILSAHNWDLELAISSISSNPSSSSSATADAAADSVPTDFPVAAYATLGAPAPPGLAWRLVTLPFSLAARTIGFTAWIAGGALTRSLSILGLLPPLDPLPVSPSATEAAEFVASFSREFGAATAPRFVAEGFMDALQRSQREYKLLFVYLHSPDHPDVPGFCERCLCSTTVSALVNEHFVAWGGSVRGTEGFRMSNTLKASRFPFCAIVMASTNQRIAILQQIEGSKSPEEMVVSLQRIIEEHTPGLIAARLDVEERRNNIRLREEQDAAYRAALEADQARERQRKEEQERLEREVAEAARKHRDEEEARERAAREAAEKEAAIVRRRQEKAMSLDAEPEKGPDVAEVLFRFPGGERKGRRFHSSAAIKSLYDYVDSLDCLTAEKYSLVSSFPRVIYGPDKLSISLKDSGLHPRASLFIEANSP